MDICQRCIGPTEYGKLHAVVPRPQMQPPRPLSALTPGPIMGWGPVDVSQPKELILLFLMVIDRLEVFCIFAVVFCAKIVLTQFSPF